MTNFYNIIKILAENIGYIETLKSKDYINFEKKNKQIVYYFNINYLTHKDIIIKITSETEIKTFFRKVEEHND